MNIIKRITVFFGSIYFALVLILLAALSAIAGTFIESHTHSHLYAVYSVYQHPIFILLLWGFFLNIFLSTCRRWPFRVKHIPFIITHIGLLMILAGILYKSLYGKQGTLVLLEGSGQDEIIINPSKGIQIEQKSISGPPHQKAMIPLDLTPGKRLQAANSPAFEDVYMEVLGYYPHCRQTVETWIKGDFCVISGLPPISVTPFDDTKPFIKKAAKIQLLPLPSLPWDLIALKARDPDAAFKAVYAENYTKPLTGIPSEHRLSAVIPTLLFIEDPSKQVHLYSFDATGTIHTEIFTQEMPDRYVVYDQGFRGYCQWADLPYSPLVHSEEDLEKRKMDLLKTELRSAEETSSPLCLPLELLRKACLINSLDFPDTTVDFLYTWNASNTLLMTHNSSLKSQVTQCLRAIDWNLVSEELLNGCYWTSYILHELDKRAAQGIDVWTSLKQLNWPFLDDLQTDISKDSLTTPLQKLIPQLVGQIFYLSPVLPPRPLDSRPTVAWLCSLLLLHGIHLDAIPKPLQVPAQSLKIECPISFKYTPTTPLKKYEDNTPLIHLKISHRDLQESVYLRYDAAMNHLKQPVLNGQYLLRFQPLYEKIPYRVRLRQARQINYPDSSQPYSFEADVIVTDNRSGTPEEATLSMNRVYETWDGYRFYLANITPSEVGFVKRVQIVVNLDPGKYWLTYPGGVMVVIGSLLLFWLKPYSQHNKR